VWYLIRSESQSNQDNMFTLRRSRLIRSESQSNQDNMFTLRRSRRLICRQCIMGTSLIPCLDTLVTSEVETRKSRVEICEILSAASFILLFVVINSNRHEHWMAMLPFSNSIIIVRANTHIFIQYLARQFPLMTHLNTDD
jgi:hypothetical protein